MLSRDDERPLRAPTVSTLTALTLRALMEDKVSYRSLNWPALDYQPTRAPIILFFASRKVQLQLQQELYDSTLVVVQDIEASFRVQISSR